MDKSDQDDAKVPSTITFGTPSRAQLMWSKSKEATKNITVEPVMLLFALGVGFIPITLNQLYYDKVCKTGTDLFGNGTAYPSEICDEIDSGKYEDIQVYVQQQVARLTSVATLVKAIPPLIFVWILGAWSDKFGRKLLIAMPLLGDMFMAGSLLINAIFFYELDADWLLLETIHDLGGGFACFSVGINSYIADISSEKARTMRMSFLELMYITGQALSFKMSGLVLSHYGYIPTLSVALAFFSLAFLYGVFFLKESKKASKEERKAAWKQLFSTKNFTETFKVIFRPREGQRRKILQLLVVFCLIYEYNRKIGYTLDMNFLRRHFEWDTDEFPQWFASYASFGNVVSVFKLGIIIPLLTRYFGLPDALLISLGSLGGMYVYTIFLSVPTANLLYLSFIDIFSAGIPVGTRSIMSKTVEAQELGKALAMLSFCYCLVGILSPTATYIYSLTVDWHEGFMLCIECLFYGIMFCLGLIIHFLQRKLWKTEIVLHEN